jgi:hypothetical protein
MKYNLTRKLNLKRFFPEMQYETIDFAVLEADSPKQAQEEMDKWIKEWLADKTADYRINKSKEDLFMEDLEKTGEAFSKTISKIKTKKVLNDK